MKKLFFSKFKNYSILTSFASLLVMVISALVKSKFLLLYSGILMVASVWWVFFHFYLIFKVGVKLKKIEKTLDDPFVLNEKYSLREISKGLTLSPFETFILIDLVLRQNLVFKPFELESKKPFTKRLWQYQPES